MRAPLRGLRHATSGMWESNRQIPWHVANASLGETSLVSRSIVASIRTRLSAPCGTRKSTDEPNFFDCLAQASRDLSYYATIRPIGLSEVSMLQYLALSSNLILCDALPGLRGHPVNTLSAAAS